MTLPEYPALALFIAGRWITGGRETVAVIDPSTEQSLGQLPLATAADLDEAIAAAVHGFALWRATPAYERSQVVRRIAGLLRERRDLLAATISRELGKPYPEAQREADTAAEMFEWAAEEGRRAYGRIIPARTAGQRLEATWEPVGPVAAFGPWNAPAITPARKISGALAAGCSVIIKPSEETPATALVIARAAQDAGLPDGVLNMVFGEPDAVSRHLLDASEIRMLTFTGSTAVGRTLAARAGQGLKRMTLELGGHAPVLVFGDVDVEAVAAGAVAAKFRNAGQVCTSPTRFYVHHTIYDRFADRFVELTRGLKVADPFTAGAQMGPLANARRLDAMAALVADARARGVTVVGGERTGNQGYYFQPTVLRDAGDDCLAANTEPFGPLAVLSPFTTVEEALARANRLEVGLAGYAFTHDAGVQARVGEALRVGTLAINHWQASWPETPFGGRGASGFGVEGGVEGLQEFREIKLVSRS